MFERTLERLHSLRLGGMVQALEDQMRRAGASELTFEERVTLMVDRQWELREQRRVDRRVRNAKLKQGACAEDIDYHYARGLDRGRMETLLACHWIRAGRNLIVTGATGLGKSWLACAVADRACREGFTASYTRVPRLLEELTLARADGSYLKMLEKLAKVDLLILDDWGLAPLEGMAQHAILEVVDDRASKRSTLVTSQLPIKKWHGMVLDPSVADALLDRLVGTAELIELKGESMRRKRSAEQA